jgi:uncharacterized membrane protein YphA (DoxX/SURF4 family)
MSDVDSYTLRSQHAASPWALPVRFLFRFFFVYLLLTGSYWIFQFADKSTAFLSRPFNAMWKPFVLWTAAHLYHWSGGIEPTFVRDTRYLFSLLTCFLVFAALAAFVWSLLDRKRTGYPELNDGLRMFLRYVLAYLLLHYGIDKLFLLQFPAPSLARLTERAGDYSPSSLMWVFIGSSASYTIFGGLTEVLGAALLLFRRTTTLGALVALGVMLNVAAMDFSYDVGVKVLCLHILLMATYLVLPEMRRLVNFFVLNRATQAVKLEAVPLSATARLVVTGVKVCVIVLLIVPLTLREWKSYREIGLGAPHPPLYGLYDVDSFSVDGVEHPPLLTDVKRWRSVILETPNTITVRHMDDSLSTYRMHYDAGLHKVDFDAPGDVADKSQLTVATDSGGGMDLQGEFAGMTVKATLHRVDRSSFTLVNRGFHWLSDSSYIR